MLYLDPLGHDCDDEPVDGRGVVVPWVCWFKKSAKPWETLWLINRIQTRIVRVFDFIFWYNYDPIKISSIL